MGNPIPKRFIGTLDDSNIQAGAGILTTKLADGSKFVKNDGTSSAATGSQDMGNNKIVNLATPTTGTDGANKSYVDGLYNNFPQLFKYKGNVKASAVVNITVSNPGTAVFDGVTLSVNDEVFLSAQTATAEIGLYTFNGTAVALTRVTRMDAWAEIPGAMFTVDQGTTNADKIFLITSDQGGTLGTTAITFITVNAASGLTSSNFVNNEVVTGTINGANTAFTLANTPVASSEDLYINGYHLIRGTDYTISGNAITMIVAPLTGESFIADYRK